MRATATRAAGSALPAEAESEIDGGELVARVAPGRGGSAALGGCPGASVAHAAELAAVGRRARFFGAAAGGQRRVFARLGEAGRLGAAGALAALADDLTVPVPRSEIGELDDIAVGIGTLARRLEEARRIQDQMGRDLARQERLAALGRVVAGVAHEVRNPLASIKLRLDLASGGVALPPEARAAIDHASSEITRLDRLVADLLIVAGRALGPRAPLDVGAPLGCARRGAGPLGGAASGGDHGARRGRSDR